MQVLRGPLKSVMYGHFGALTQVMNLAMKQSDKRYKLQICKVVGDHLLEREGRK